jgi:hypothetical protein
LETLRGISGVVLILLIPRINGWDWVGSTGRFRFGLVIVRVLGFILSVKAKRSHGKSEGKEAAAENKSIIGHSHSLGNYDHVAGEKKNVLILILSLHDFFVVKRMLSLFSVFVPENINAFEFCKLSEATSAG